MWTLSADDVQRAKDELQGRRAAIQAHYDTEMQRVESSLAELEGFERIALNFMVNFKNGSESAAADPATAPAADAVETATAERATSWEAPVERSGETDASKESDSGDGEPKSSRWRVRFGSAEAAA